MLSLFFLVYGANPRLKYGCFLPVSKSSILGFLFLLISSNLLFSFLLIGYTYSYIAEILLNL